MVKIAGKTGANVASEAKQAKEIVKSTSSILAELEEENRQRQKNKLARTAELEAAKDKAEKQRLDDHETAKAASRRIAEGRAAKMQLLQNDEMNCPRQSIFYITGSWDDWIPHEMVYNKFDQSCHCIIQLGQNGSESFNILMDGDPLKCLYPEDADSSTLCGPGENGQSKSWSIGKHQLDDGAPGIFYEIKLHINVDGQPTKLDWTKLGNYPKAPACKYWIVGTWDEWEPHEMSWDPKRLCFKFFVQLGVKGKESFRLLANGDWTKCLYPNHYESFHDGHQINGPDANVKGKSWTIGGHHLDVSEEGGCYEVRLRLKLDGNLLDVDWVRVDADKPNLPASMEKDAEEAMRQYIKRLTEPIDDLPAWDADQLARISEWIPDYKPFALESVVKKCKTIQEENQLCQQDARNVRKQMEKDLARGARRFAKNNKCGSVFDSDGEEVRICGHCGLPMGSFSYTPEGASSQRVHGECMAQYIIDDLRREMSNRLQSDASIKKKKREEYGIGWKAGHIPLNVGVAARLNCSPVPQGMCCLVLDNDSRKITVAPTIEPAVAVNLAYLSMALQVRLREGREPLFSLDPIDSDHKFHDSSLPEIWMQKKRFQPEWLAGTSIGEVMFQADYHLKELSMGECDQPVLGMKTCHDLSEKDYYDSHWYAREWFVIKKAFIQLTEDDVLIPNVKMGVEAREMDGAGHDKKVTRPDHPMVKYAEQFTKNFDLIAERKSVIFNLRELAKATVLAKYLIDAKIELDDSWFSLADEEMGCCTIEIPQLWNERARQKLIVKDGQVKDSDSVGLVQKMYGIYGGVEFGVDRMPAVAKPVRVVRVPAPRLPAFAARGPPPSAGAPAPEVPAAAVAKAAAVLPAVAVGRRPIPTVAKPGGPVVAGVITPAQRIVEAPVPPQPKAREAPAVRYPMPGAPALLSAGVPIPSAPAILSAGIPIVSAGVPAILGSQATGMYPQPGAAVAAMRQPAASIAAMSAKPMSPPGRHPQQVGASLSSMRHASTYSMGADIPQGVDLDLGRFDLTESNTSGLEESIADASLVIGKAFWSTIEGESAAMLKDEDVNLIKTIFHPVMSDRREEGDNFIPPVANKSYLQSLRECVLEEEMLRQKRIDHFLSLDFSMYDFCELFPFSWKESFDVARKHTPTRNTDKLYPRPDYKNQAAVLEEHLKTTSPIFDKQTEDGLRFRIYTVGSLQVRTTQSHDGEEIVGEVFSMCALTSASPTGSEPRAILGSEKISKVTMYVENAMHSTADSELLDCHYYVVIETVTGNSIVTEKLRDGSVVFNENPADVDDRNFLAKAIDMKDCSESGVIVSVRDMRSTADGQYQRTSASYSDCKRYARRMCNRANGETARGPAKQYSKCISAGAWLKKSAHLPYQS